MLMFLCDLKHHVHASLLQHAGHAGPWQAVTVNPLMAVKVYPLCPVRGIRMQMRSHHTASGEDILKNPEEIQREKLCGHPEMPYIKSEAELCLPRGPYEVPGMHEHIA